MKKQKEATCQRCSGAETFDRVKKLNDLFEDRDWRFDQGNVDDFKMAKVLDDYVKDLGFEFLALRAMLERYPNREQWAEGDLQTMYDAMLDDQEAAKRAHPPPPRRARRRKTRSVKKQKEGLSAKEVYHASKSGMTRSFLCQLENRGHLGYVAAALFRAQKASTRAKAYRGGPFSSGPAYTDLAYSRKSESLSALCDLLAQDACSMTWGWGIDEEGPGPIDVLYVDLPEGQVSFHSEERFAGPDYPGGWDGQHASESRIIAFCDCVHETERRE